MLGGAGNFVDGLLSVGDAFLGKMRADIGDYLDIETADDPVTLVAKDGSLLTMLRIDGMRSIISRLGLFEQVIMPLTTGLQSSFENRAHQVQVWFEEDYDQAVIDIERMQAPARETARRLKLRLNDVLDARASQLAQSVSSQRCFIVAFTRPAALGKAEKKLEKKLITDARNGAPGVAEAQDPLRAVSMLRNRHRAFVGLLGSKFSDVGVVASVVGVRDTLREVRKSIIPSFTAENWSAAIPGDRMYPSRRKRHASSEKWDVIWPSLGWQICARDAIITSPNVVEVGDRIYSPIYIDLFPRDPHVFTDLFRNLRDKRVPWRISFLMEGGGLSGFTFRKSVSTLMSFANRGNAMFKRAMGDLQHFADREAGALCQARVTLCTWAPRTDPDLLASRVSDLAGSVSGWGSCQVSEVTGDPIAGMMSSALGATLGSVGTKAIAPMSDFMGMMPWDQPASAWSSGAILFRSPGGKLMPFQPYSKHQATWISLFFAPPGSGKSVLMNASHLALALGPGSPRLPRIAIIDIGPSSSGLISLIREALPPDQRHLAVHRRLQMSEQYAINPFDTQLGCRFPTSIERMFLTNFLSLLVTDMSKQEPETAMTGLVGAVVDEMYASRSDSAEPNLYASGVCVEIDEALRDARISIDRRTTWWEVVDQLFTCGNIHAASMANRYAVPLLQDAVAAANGEKVRATYSAPRISTGEGVIQAFSRMVGEALSFFPILGRPTAFDLGGARIAALDLNAVARGGSGAVSRRITAVMYMLARQVLAKDFYLNREEVLQMPAPPEFKLRDTVPAQAYRDYHSVRAAEIFEDPKRICFDEFHRTESALAVREQVEVDMREGRKWHVDIMLASQSLSDFDDKMVEFASGMFIMSGGTQATVNSIAQRFGFTDPSEIYHLTHSVHDPRPPEPGVFMAKFKTKSGVYTNLLSLVLSPQEFWALCTDADNISLRDRLYERIGPQAARRVLAVAFPYGALSEIEQRRDSLRQRAGMLDDAQEQSVIITMAEELESRFHLLESSQSSS